MPVPGVPLRLILLDLGGGRTVAVAIGFFVSHDPAVYEAGVADAMQVVESFAFHPPAP